jgi:hypothetical protein
MKQCTISAWLILAFLASAASAKDTPMTVNQCPAPVQAIIRHYSAQGTFETVAFDEKKKSGGPPTYEAKFTLRGGRRIEVHITPEGKVLQFEEKKRQN